MSEVPLQRLRDIACLAHSIREARAYCKDPRDITSQTWKLPVDLILQLKLSLCSNLFPFLQGCIFILDTIPITALSDAMDLEAARLEECSTDDEVPECLDEDESAVLVEKIRTTGIQ